MVKKRKWTEDQRNNFARAMARRKIVQAHKQADQLKAEFAAEREERANGIDASIWNNEQRPPHIYIQEAGRLRRYDLRSLEVYVPEDTSL